MNRFSNIKIIEIAPAPVTYILNFGADAPLFSYLKFLFLNFLTI